MSRAAAELQTHIDALFPICRSITGQGLRQTLGYIADKIPLRIWEVPTGTAVLDWEIAHFGDPMEDLGWICVNSWRFGGIDKPVGGFGTREELFAGYEEAGRKADPDRVMFWEVMGTLRWGIMCCGMMQRFRLGPDHSLERAMIGRRSSETEIDLLRLLAPRGA